MGGIQLRSKRRGAKCRRQVAVATELVISQEQEDSLSGRKKGSSGFKNEDG